MMSVALTPRAEDEVLDRDRLIDVDSLGPDRAGGLTLGLRRDLARRTNAEPLAACGGQAGPASLQYPSAAISSAAWPSSELRRRSHLFCGRASDPCAFLLVAGSGTGSGWFRFCFRTAAVHQGFRDGSLMPRLEPRARTIHHFRRLHANDLRTAQLCGCRPLQHRARRLDIHLGPDLDLLLLDLGRRLTCGLSAATPP